MPAMLIVANMRKSLYPKLVTREGVTFDNTKSTTKAHLIVKPHNKKRETRTKEPLRSTSRRQSEMPRPRIKDIRTIHPRKWTPSHRIETYINIQHSRHRFGCSRWVGGSDFRWGVGLEDSTDDEEEDAHAHGRDEEGHLSAQGFDEEEHEDGGSDDFDDSVDPGGEEGDRGARVSDLFF